MRVGILTHPQAINYGGILQCYALSTYLEKMGHKAIVIRREQDTVWYKLLLSPIVKKIRLRKLLHPRQIDKGAQIRPFSEKYLNRTSSIKTRKVMLHACEKYKLDAVIVGSDQVWRADFAMLYGYNYFLDFVPTGIKRLSYAASFGLSEWKYNTEQTLHIKELLSRFQGISVREEDAIQLCHKYLGVEVEKMIDPTMLLSATEYNSLSSPKLINEKYVFVYWLGDVTQIERQINEYQEKGYIIIRVGLREEKLLPSVEEWLSYIKYAEVVITDSFHGCVYTILFHRPLKVCENQSGGYGRIKSLFDALGVSVAQMEKPSNDTFDMIEGRLDSLRKKSHHFLQSTLV